MKKEGKEVKASISKKEQDVQKTKKLLADMKSLWAHCQDTA